MPKFEKGSKEAKEWGLKMKQAKEAKKKEKEDLAPITIDDLEPFDDEKEAPKPKPKPKPKRKREPKEQKGVKVKVKRKFYNGIPYLVNINDNTVYDNDTYEPIGNYFKDRVILYDETYIDDEEIEFTPSTKGKEKYEAKKEAKKIRKEQKKEEKKVKENIKKIKEKAEKVKQVKFRQQTLDLPFDMKKEILGFLPSFTKKDKDRLEDLFQNYLDFNEVLLNSLDIEDDIKIPKKLKDKLDRVRTRLYDLKKKIEAILEKNGVEINEDELYYDVSDISFYNLKKIGLYYDYGELESFDKKKLDEYLDSLDFSIYDWEKEITEIGDKQLPFKPIK